MSDVAITKRSTGRQRIARCSPRYDRNGTPSISAVSAASPTSRGNIRAGLRAAVVLGRLSAEVGGFNLQAATRIAATDRPGLERMARYLARPPVATDRLTRLGDGRLELQLKRAWRDGTTAFVFTPHELIERLVAVVPRRRAHLTRYFGVLAPAFAARAEIVPAGATKSPGARTGTAGADGGRDPLPESVPRRRFAWASLIWRVFLKDVL